MTVPRVKYLLVFCPAHSTLCAGEQRGPRCWRWWQHWRGEGQGHSAGPCSPWTSHQARISTSWSCHWWACWRPRSSGAPLPPPDPSLTSEHQHHSLPCHHQLGTQTVSHSLESSDPKIRKIENKSFIYSVWSGNMEQINWSGGGRGKILRLDGRH